MDPFIGQIMPVGFNFAPRGWALCNGALLAISSHTAVFSLLGTTFGGDGRTTFGLPDLRGRSMVGIGNGPGLDSITWGEKGGYYEVQLSANNMPSHSHQLIVGGTGRGSNYGSSPISGYPAELDSSISGWSTSPTGDRSASTTPAGGGQPFNTRNPFLGVYVCIALQGIFPPRS